MHGAVDVSGAHPALSATSRCLAILILLSSCAVASVRLYLCYPCTSILAALFPDGDRGTVALSPLLPRFRLSALVSFDLWMSNTNIIASTQAFIGSYAAATGTFAVFAYL
jgi:hypothetical protein